MNIKIRDEQMRFIFRCEAEAREVYRQARTLAVVYGRVTLADINEIIGNRVHYNDTKIYWTAARFDTDVKVYPKENGEWEMYIFDHLIDESCDDTEEAEETEDNVDDTCPVYINVTTSDMDDPDCILGSVFKHTREFRDRDVFINVY